MVVGETMHGEFEIIWNGFEEEAKNTIGESSWMLGIWNNTMNNMHFEVEKLTVNGVLRRRMEMVLEALQLGARAVLVEQPNGIGEEIIVIWCLVFHHKLVLAAFLVVFQLFFGINFGVLELEGGVLKGFQDGNTCLKVDWCLLDAVADDALLLLLQQVVVGSEPVVLSKLTWPLIESVHVVFAVVVVVVALLVTTGCLGASWHAADDWHFQAIDQFQSWALLLCFN